MNGLCMYLINTSHETARFESQAVSVTKNVLIWWPNNVWRTEFIKGGFESFRHVFLKHWLKKSNKTYSDYQKDKG